MFSYNTLYTLIIPFAVVTLFIIQYCYIKPNKNLSNNIITLNNIKNTYYISVSTTKIDNIPIELFNSLNNNNDDITSKLINAYLCNKILYTSKPIINNIRTLLTNCSYKKHIDGYNYYVKFYNNTEQQYIIIKNNIIIKTKHNNIPLFCELLDDHKILLIEDNNIYYICINECIHCDVDKKDIDKLCSNDTINHKKFSRFNKAIIYCFVCSQI